MFICQRCVRPVLGLGQSLCWFASRLLYRDPSKIKRYQCSQRLVSQRFLSGMSSENASQTESVLNSWVDCVYVWGNAETGALGSRALYEKGVQPSPMKLDFKDGHTPVHAALGYGFSVYTCLTLQGHRLYGCGLNTSGQLGSHSNQDYESDLIISLELFNKDYVNDENKLQSYRLSEEIVDVSCGKAHTWIVTKENKVFSFGSNSYGQCGKPLSTRSEDSFIFDEKIKKVYCGLDHTMVLTEQGEVYSCGLGADGQTGLGHYGAVDTLTKVGGDIEGEKIVSLSCKADTVLALSDKGDVFGWGNSEYGQFNAVVGKEMQINIPRHLPLLKGKNFVQVTAAGTMCGVLDDEGDVYVWGYGLLGNSNDVKQLTNPELIPKTAFNVNPSSDPEQIIQLTCGLTCFAAVTESGHLFMWGKQRMGCLGINNSESQMEDVNMPTKVSLPGRVIQVLCGVDHTVALCKSK